MSTAAQPASPTEPPNPATPAASGTSPAAKSAQTIKITPEFQQVLRLLKDGHNVFIQGSAGTGKSTFLKWLRRQLTTAGKTNYAVLAPTGLAALNVGGQTIHGFFRFPTTLLNPSVLRKPRQPKLFKALQLIVIDEISMVRADILDAMDAFLRLYGPTAKKPFGGVQLMLMGDIFQLPPVLSRTEAPFFAAYQTPYFFSAAAYATGGFYPVEFTEIFRQTDAFFIDLLNQVRHGDPSPDLLKTLNQRHSLHHPPEDVRKQVILAARVAQVEERNAAELARLPGAEKVYHAATSGDFDLRTPPSPAELRLRPGARVMFTRNHKEGGSYVNGTLGTVVKCQPDTVTVRLDSESPNRSDEIRVEPISWELTRYKANDAPSDQPSLSPSLFTTEVAGSFTQLPLTLAWALTIHKAQGQTLPGCLIDLGDGYGGGAFAEGQLYVALSRARSLDTLFLAHPLKPRDLRTHPAVRSFYDHTFG